MVIFNLLSSSYLTYFYCTKLLVLDKLTGLTLLFFTNFSSTILVVKKKTLMFGNKPNIFLIFNM